MVSPREIRLNERPAERKDCLGMIWDYLIDGPDVWEARVLRP